MPTIQEVLKSAKADFIESGHHHCRPGWIQLKQCPWCRSDNYHLGINLDLKFASCWKCGGHHLAQVFIKLGIAYKQAQGYFTSLDTSEAIKLDRTRGSLKEPPSRKSLLGAHRLYLRTRKFDPDKIQRIWKVQGIGIAARLAWRIYIPIILNNEVVSWTTRAIGDRVQQRYISASAEEESMDHKDLIYGRDYCNHSIVIVEGPTDAWRVGPGAGALFGTAFTPAQVLELADIPYRYICFDSSSIAQARARELAGQLSVFPGETHVVELDAADPGSAPEKEINALRKLAKLT